MLTFPLQLKGKERPSVVSESCRVVSAVLRRSPNFPETSRHFSATAPNLIASLANCVEVSKLAPR